MSYENCGSAHQIEELDHEFDNSALDLNSLLDRALSRKHTKHDYEDPIIHHFSRYNSNHLIRLHAADKSFNSYEGGSVAELTAVEIHRDENDIPINHRSNSSALQNRIETRDKRPQSDAPLQNIHENSKLTTNKSHTSSAKRLDVLEDPSQDGKVPHYFKDQYQNTRKTSAAKDDYGFSGEFNNKNSHSEQNQSHPYNNNSLTDSEKMSEIMHLAYLKGRGHGTEPSDGGVGIEFMSKEPSMIELSNKDFDNSPKATEEDYLEEYKYEEAEQKPHHNVQISNQLREILVPISQAENESEDSESERIHPSDLLPDNETENIHRTPGRKHHTENTENLSESQNLEEAIAIENRKGSNEQKRDEKAMRGQRQPTEVSPASASESIDEFVASRFSGISPRDPRGSITKGDTLIEGQLLSSRSQKEGEERVETQEYRETEGDQHETHEKIHEESEEEEEIENFQTCQSQEIVAEEEFGGVKRGNQEEKAIGGSEVIHEQSLEDEETEDFKSCMSGEIAAEFESKRVNQEGNIFEGHVIEEQSEEEEEAEVEERKRSQSQHQEKLAEGGLSHRTRAASNQEGTIVSNEKNGQEPENIKEVQEEVIQPSHQEHTVSEEDDVKNSNRKESENLDQVGLSHHHQKTGQSEELANNASSENVVKANVQENEVIESTQFISADNKNHQENKTDSNDIETQEKIQAEKTSNEVTKRVEEKSQTQGISEIRQASGKHIQENDQKYSSATEAHPQEELVNAQKLENVNQDSSETILKKGIPSENQTENAINSENGGLQESIHQSENKVGNRNQKEIDSNQTEKKENKHAENNLEKSIDMVEQGFETHESEIQNLSEIRQTPIENIQENAQRDSSPLENKAQEELVKTDILERPEKANQDSVQKNEDKTLHSVQGDAQKASIVSSGNQGENAANKKDKTENKEGNQDQRVKDSEVCEDTSKTKPALGENVKEDSHKDSSIAQEGAIKTDDVSQQLAEAQERENNIENKTQDVAKSVHSDVQKESIDASGNKEDNHGENISLHKNVVNAEETQVSGNTEKNNKESAEEHHCQVASSHDDQTQEDLNAPAEAGKKSTGGDILVPEQKEGTQGIEEENQRREVSLGEETKEAREEHKKKSSQERDIKESKPQDNLNDSEGEKLEAVKELEATEATARNRENDADNLTETQNETDAHTERLDEKLISIVGSIKEFEGEEGILVNQDGQIVTGEIHAGSNAQQQEINETEKRQNKLVSGVESAKDSEATVIAENNTDKQETSEVQISSSKDHQGTENQKNTQQNSSASEVIAQKTETQKKQEESGNLPTDKEQVESDENVTSHAAAVDLVKGSEAHERIDATQENQTAPHIQAQNENNTQAVQQKKEIEKSQEKLASEAVEGSSASKKQEDKSEKENGENDKSDSEVHHQQKNVNQGSASTQGNTIQTNQTSEISNNPKDSQETHRQQQSNTESSSSSSEIEKEGRPVELPHESQDKIQSAKNESEVKKHSNNIDSETKINSTHNNTIRTVDEEHKSASEITHNILDLTTQTSKESAEVKRVSKATSPQKPSDKFLLDPQDKLQIKQLLDQIQEEESQENMISPQHIQTHQEQPTQEVSPHLAAVSTPVKSKKPMTTTTATASTGTDFILHKTQIEEKGTQTEVEEEKEVPPAIPIQKVTHFRSLSSTKKKQRSTFRLFEKSVGEYEKDIDFMSKYTTKEVIQNLDHTPEQMEALFESAKKLYKITDDTPRGPPSDDELGGILNRVVMARSPIKEGRIDYSLIPIYQQVEETYEDGTRYEGEKFLGKRHGTGTYYYKEGYKYVGNWEQDVMSGFGVLWLNENEKWYEGEWANSVFHGRGSLYNTNPEKLNEEKAYLEDFDEIGNGWERYEGQFLDGKRHRFGTILLSNGDVFVGNFKENKAEGRGSYTKANKKMIVGEWCNNKLKKVF